MGVLFCEWRQAGARRTSLSQQGRNTSQAQDVTSGAAALRLRRKVARRWSVLSRSGRRVRLLTGPAGAHFLCLRWRPVVGRQADTQPRVPGVPALHNSLWRGGLAARREHLPICDADSPLQGRRLARVAERRAISGHFATAPRDRRGASAWRAPGYCRLRFRGVRSGRPRARRKARAGTEHPQKGEAAL